MIVAVAVIVVLVVVGAVATWQVVASDRADRRDLARRIEHMVGEEDLVATTIEREPGLVTIVLEKRSGG